MPTLPPLPRTLTEPLVANALREDFGRAGDITTDAIISPTKKLTAKLNARQAGTLAGMDMARLAFELVDPKLKITQHKKDGTRLKKGDVALTITGAARSILMAERVALNFACHLSGIASATADFTAQTKGTRAHIVCTRKTTPGLRSIEKHAVRLGGGKNHRYGLDDAILIKDNHIAAVGSISKALDKAVSFAGHMTKILIEVDTLKQLDEVISHGGADNVMLDNMSLDQMRDAVARINGAMKVEASGNVTQERVSDIAQTGVDYISSGWITNSAPNLDLGLDF